jgi:catechol 2,3-dioxygenase-like lactoylglutathione lyase family enzyme
MVLRMVGPIAWGPPLSCTIRASHQASADLPSPPVETIVTNRRTPIVEAAGCRRAAEFAAVAVPAQGAFQAIAVGAAELPRLLEIASTLPPRESASRGTTRRRRHGEGDRRWRCLPEECGPEGARSLVREAPGRRELGDSGATFWWKDEVPKGTGMTVWNPFPKDTTYFGEGNQAVMINYRVDDLDALLAELAAAGVWIDPKRQDESYGRFAWIKDRDGNRVELWQPQ